MATPRPSTSFERLLAKSAAPSKGETHTLQGHTSMVVAAAHRLLALTGEHALRAVGLDLSNFERLRRIVLVGAFLHDLGKCSEHFQEMVRGMRSGPQLVRHEAATLWLAWPGRPLAAWLMSALGSDEDLILALCAGAAHHRKFWSRAIAPEGERTDTEMRLLASHPDFAALLAKAGTWTELKFGPPPALADVTIAAHRRSLWPETFLGECEDECRDLLLDNAVLLGLAKAFVLDADIAGSALPKAEEDLSWIERALRNRPSGEEFAGIVERRLNGSPARPFQETVAETRAPVTLVVAGCGSGKTLAAYKWAANQHAGRQLWVTYPTTGTATEGYRDYLADPELSLDARLEHSRAVVDLEILGEAGEEQRDLDRLEALRLWGSKVVTSTADTVLGLMQNHRRALYSWPGLAHAAVVFDEIHAYDDQMFGVLLRFLETFRGIPVLLMTASLPASRREALEALCVRVHGCDLAVVHGPAELERIPRYKRVESENPWSQIEACVREGGKVLFVSNTVDRCRDNAETARALGVASIVYHSRFRYEDRVERHGDVIKAFRAEEGCLALTTQVAEMSLDISADLLVSDLAPVPALIQRLGRLNRRAQPDGSTGVKEFIVIRPDEPAPYTKAQLEVGAAWLESLGCGALSQYDLISKWSDDSGTAQVVTCPWIDGGFSTEPGELRESSPGIQVLLPSDAELVRGRKCDPVRVAIPMLAPSGGAWRKWRRERGYVVVPEGAIVYDRELGAQWE